MGEEDICILHQKMNTTMTLAVAIVIAAVTFASPVPSWTEDGTAEDSAIGAAFSAEEMTQLTAAHSHHHHRRRKHKYHGDAIASRFPIERDVSDRLGEEKEMKDKEARRKGKCCCKHKCHKGWHMKLLCDQCPLGSHIVYKSIHDPLSEGHESKHLQALDAWNQPCISGHRCS